MYLKHSTQSTQTKTAEIAVVEHSIHEEGKEFDLKAGETATFEDLPTGTTYRVTETSSGSFITGAEKSETFTAPSVSGTKTVELAPFDATDLKDHTLVVYEYLNSEVTGTEVAKHEDESDVLQTIYIPEIKTTANLSDDNKVVTDLVAYSNIIPSSADTHKKYVFKGWLVDTVTGTKIEGSDSSYTLTDPGSASGSVSMDMSTAAYVHTVFSMQTSISVKYMSLSVCKESYTCLNKVQVCFAIFPISLY